MSDHAENIDNTVGDTEELPKCYVPLIRIDSYSSAELEALLKKCEGTAPVETIDESSDEDYRYQYISSASSEHSENEGSVTRVSPLPEDRFTSEEAVPRGRNDLGQVSNGTEETMVSLPSSQPKKKRRRNRIWARITKPKRKSNSLHRPCPASVSARRKSQQATSVVEHPPNGSDVKLDERLSNHIPSHSELKMSSHGTGASFQIRLTCDSPDDGPQLGVFCPTNDVSMGGKGTVGTSLLIKKNNFAALSDRGVVRRTHTVESEPSSRNRDVSRLASKGRGWKILRAMPIKELLRKLGETKRPEGRVARTSAPTASHVASKYATNWGVRINVGVGHTLNAEHAHNMLLLLDHSVEAIPLHLARFCASVVWTPPSTPSPTSMLFPVRSPRLMYYALEKARSRAHPRPLPPSMKSPPKVPNVVSPEKRNLQDDSEASEEPVVAEAPSAVVSPSQRPGRGPTRAVRERTTPKKEANTKVSPARAPRLLPLTRSQDPVADEVASLLDSMVENIVSGEKCAQAPYDPDDIRGIGSVSAADTQCVLMPTREKDKENSALMRATRELRRLNVALFDVEPTPAIPVNCSRDSCRLGCVCHSLSGKFVRDHCGNESCMFACVCDPLSSSLPEKRHINFAWMQSKAKENLAKEECKFKQTVMRGTDDTVVLVENSRKRQIKLPGRYRVDFVTRDSDLVHVRTKSGTKIYLKEAEPEPDRMPKKKAKPDIPHPKKKAGVEKVLGPSVEWLNLVNLIQDSEATSVNATNSPLKDAREDRRPTDRPASADSESQSPRLSARACPFPIRSSNERMERQKRLLAESSCEKLNITPVSEKSKPDTSSRIQSVDSLGEQQRPSVVASGTAANKHSIFGDIFKDKQENDVVLLPWDSLSWEVAEKTVHVWLKFNKSKTKSNVYVTKTSFKPYETCIDINDISEDSEVYDDLPFRLETVRPDYEMKDGEEKFMWVVKLCKLNWQIVGFLEPTQPVEEEKKLEPDVDIESSLKNSVDAEAGPSQTPYRWWLLNVTSCLDFVTFLDFDVCVKYSQMVALAHLANKSSSRKKWYRILLPREKLKSENVPVAHPDFGVYGIHGLPQHVLFGPYDVHKEPRFRAFRNSTDQETSLKSVPVFCCGPGKCMRVNNEGMLESYRPGKESTIPDSESVKGCWLYVWQRDLCEPNTSKTFREAPQIESLMVEKDVASTENSVTMDHDENAATLAVNRNLGKTTADAEITPVSDTSSLDVAEDEIELFANEIFDDTELVSSPEGAQDVESVTEESTPTGSKDLAQEKDTSQAKGKRKDIPRRISVSSASSIEEISNSSVETLTSQPTGRLAKKKRKSVLEKDSLGQPPSKQSRRSTSEKTTKQGDTAGHQHLKQFRSSTSGGTASQDVSVSAMHQKNMEVFLVPNIPEIGYIRVVQLPSGVLSTQHFTRVGQLQFFKTTDEVIKTINTIIHKKLVVASTRCAWPKQQFSCTCVKWEVVYSSKKWNGCLTLQEDLFSGFYMLSKTGFIDLRKLSDAELNNLGEDWIEWSTKNENIREKIGEGRKTDVDEVKGIMKDLAQLLVGPNNVMPERLMAVDVLNLAKTEIAKLCAREQLLSLEKESLSILRETLTSTLWAQMKFAPVTTVASVCRKLKSEGISFDPEDAANGSNISLKDIEVLDCPDEDPVLEIGKTKSTELSDVILQTKKCKTRLRTEDKSGTSKQTQEQPKSLVYHISESPFRRLNISVKEDGIIQSPPFSSHPSSTKPVAFISTTSTVARPGVVQSKASPSQVTAPRMSLSPSTNLNISKLPASKPTTAVSSISSASVVKPITILSVASTPSLVKSTPSTSLISSPSMVSYHASAASPPSLISTPAAVKPATSGPAVSALPSPSTGVKLVTPPNAVSTLSAMKISTSLPVVPISSVRPAPSLPKVSTFSVIKSVPSTVPTSSLPGFVKSGDKPVVISGNRVIPTFTTASVSQSTMKSSVPGLKASPPVFKLVASPPKNLVTFSTDSEKEISPSNKINQGKVLHLPLSLANVGASSSKPGVISIQSGSTFATTTATAPGNVTGKFEVLSLLQIKAMLEKNKPQHRPIILQGGAKKPVTARLVSSNGVLRLVSPSAPAGATPLPLSTIGSAQLPQRQILTKFGTTSTLRTIPPTVSMSQAENCETSENPPSETTKPNQC